MNINNSDSRNKKKYTGQIINFSDMSYLENGNEMQQQAYSIISKISILHTLRQYTPIVVGTIPIGIDIPDSDLDIICHVSDFRSFQNLIRYHFKKNSNFQDKIDNSHYLAFFSIDGLTIEIYAENETTTNQYAYLHMLIEDRLLKLLGSTFRKKIIELKLQGYKTEPAFGKLLGLQNAYVELLNFADFTDEQLIAIEKGTKK